MSKRKIDVLPSGICALDDLQQLNNLDSILKFWNVSIFYVQMFLRGQYEIRPPRKKPSLKSIRGKQFNCYWCKKDNVYKTKTTKSLNHKKQTGLKSTTKNWPSKDIFSNSHGVCLDPYEFDHSIICKPFVYKTKCVTCGNKQLQPDAIIHQQRALQNKKPEQRCECDVFKPGTVQMDRKKAIQKFTPYAKQIASFWSLYNQYGEFCWEKHWNTKIKNNNWESILNIILEHRYNK